MAFYIKYILFFLIFFFLHYIEGLPPIGSISIAQLWKIPLLIFLLLYNIIKIYPRAFFEKLGYFLSIEKMISPEFLINPMTNFIQVSRQIPFILFYGFFDRQYRNKGNVLEVILYSLAQFVCLASALTLFDIIKPLKEMDLADSFGVDVVYYSSVFGAVHAASSYFCISTLILLYGFKIKYFASRFSKLFNIFLIFIGFLSVFYSYVRTGWIMLIVGVIVIYKPIRLTYRQLSIYIFSLFLLVSVFFYLYNYNEAFYARIIGRNVYLGAESNHVEVSGSGRASFWLNGLSIWSNNDNLYDFLFGSGITEVVENNYKMTGMRVFSHNQFVDTLAQNGLVGFLLLLFFYFGLYRFVKKYSSNSPYGRLCIALFFCNLIFAFFQSEIYFLFMLMFSVSMALIHQTSINKKN